MTVLGIVCVAGCMLMMAAMMGGAGWLMNKLRPGAQPERDQVQPLA
jgi:hypothetical protein